VSFDLAVWEGPIPDGDEAALSEFERLMDLWQGDDPPPDGEPTPAIRAYVDALLSRWPDITTDEGEASPWADGPLLNNATGPVVYFAMLWSRAEDAATFAAATAKAHGLVCFDPQSCSLR